MLLQTVSFILLYRILSRLGNIQASLILLSLLKNFGYIARYAPSKLRVSENKRELVLILSSESNLSKC